MPVLVGRIKSDASSKSEIVIHSVGHDGMETNREFLSLAEAERHILSVRRAIALCRAETVTEDGPSADNGAAAPRWRRGNTVIEIIRPHPDDGSEVRDYNGHCLLRWEDDRAHRPALGRAAAVVPAGA